MTEQQKRFAQNLLNKTDSYNEWLAVMRFGLPTLLQDQEILIDAMLIRAEAMADTVPASISEVMSNMVRICADLEIKFTVGAWLR